MTALAYNRNHYNYNQSLTKIKIFNFYFLDSKMKTMNKTIRIRNSDTNKISKRSIKTLLCNTTGQMVLMLLFIGHIHSSSDKFTPSASIKNNIITCSERGKIGAFPYESENVAVLYCGAIIDSNNALKILMSKKAQDVSTPTNDQALDLSTPTNDQALDLSIPEKDYSKGLRTYKKDQCAMLDDYKDESVKEFYTSFLRLFDYNKENLECEIFLVGVYSFYQFIESYKSDQSNYKILAALFLLSEGLKLPLSFKENDNSVELILKSPNKTENVFAVVKTEKDIKIPFEEWKKHQKVDRIVDFFVKCCNSPMFNKSMETNTNIAPENTNPMFLPKYIIQRFLSFYLKGKNEIEAFNVEVYNILKEYLPPTEEIEKNKTEIQKTAEKLFKYWFLTLNHMEENEFSALIDDISICFKKIEEIESTNANPIRSECIERVKSLSLLVNKIASSVKNDFFLLTINNYINCISSTFKSSFNTITENSKAV